MSAPILFGVTAAIGGFQLAAAACFTSTCTVTGALADMPVVVTPRTFPGNGTFWYGYVSAADTVTVKLCNAEAGFVFASIFDVAVINAAGSSPGGPALKVNGVANADQALLNLQQGTGITITDAGAGEVLFTATSSGALVPIGPPQILGAPAPSVSFNAIPGTYTSLRLFMLARGDVSAVSTGFGIQFNGDSNNANYESSYLLGANGSATAGPVAGPFLGNLPGATALANAPGQIEVVIVGYTSTAFLKLARSTGCFQSTPTFSTSNLDVLDAVTNWNSMAAITSMVVSPGSGNFVAGSIFALYGVV